jgi:hypothetical protein
MPPPPELGSGCGALVLRVLPLATSSAPILQLRPAAAISTGTAAARGTYQKAVTGWISHMESRQQLDVAPLRAQSSLGL